MYGTNINNQFMMPNTSYSPMMNGAPMMSNTMIGGSSRGSLGSLLGLGGRGTGGIRNLFSGLRTINFGSILNNTSKALGVVREAIPIVKEVGPMIGNMKQMLRLAAIFKDETETTTNTETIKENSNTKETTTDEITNKKNSDTNINSTTINSRTNEYEPNFFL